MAVDERHCLTSFCSSSKLLNNFMPQEAPQPIPPALAGQSPAPKRKLWKFVVVFLAIILIAVAGYWAWTAYLSPEAKRSRAATENYERLYKGLVTDFEDAMKADTWGGKTPQETLDLFIDALRKGDVELASKYFLIETTVNDPNYLTRNEWVLALEQAKEDGRLDEIADLVSRATPDIENRAYEEDYKFAIFDDSKKLDGYINMQLNTSSGVWKIESL